MEMNLPFCPIETTLTLIGDKWKVLILRDLMEGTKRFGELKKSIGKISQKVLTSNLRDMEESGLVSRKVYAEVPPRVEYTLTEIGYSLKSILDAMSLWGVDYKIKNGCSLNSELLGENKDIAFVRNRMIFIDDLSTALELMKTVEIETECKKFILPKGNFHDDFFKISSGLMGEILQKYETYKMKMAVVGDFSCYISPPLQEFIKETNEGNSFYFVPTVNEAVIKLDN